jgi:hypothetical protein
MTDQPRLKEALHRAVPEAPAEPDRGRAARSRAARARHARRVTAVAVAAAVSVAGVAIWAGRHPEPAAPANGTGEAACRHLADSEPQGRYVDSLVVDGATASAWLARVAPHVDASSYDKDAQVTACLTSAKAVTYLRVIGSSGPPLEVSHGGLYPAKYGGIVGQLTLLDQLWKGGAATTDAPFSCSGAQTERYPRVATSLPSGALAARICYEGGFFSPPQTLTRGLASLVHAVNDAPLEYTPPNINCSGAGEPEFTIVFRFPSGTRSVSEETCRGLAVGSFTRPGVHNLDQTFMSLLTQQVDVTPGSVTAPPCQPTSDRPSGVGDPRNVVAARFCPSDSSGDRPLDQSQLALLRGWGRSLEFAASTEPEGRCAPPATGRPHLQLADAWGDTFTMTVVTCLAYGHERYLGAVNAPGSPHRVTYPLGEEHDLTRLLRELTLRP